MDLGMRVRCIDESDTNALIHGEFYRVVAVSPLGTAVVIMHDSCVEPVSDEDGCWYHASRFEPVYILETSVPS